MLKTLFTTASLLATLTAQTPQPTPLPLPSATPAPTALPSATPLPSPSPLPSITPAPSPSPVPSPMPAPTPSTTPSPSPSPTPTASASPLPTPLVLPPDAPPQILAVQISPVVHSGETVTGTVITSTNVAAVEIRMAGHAARIPRVDFGVWQLSYQIPRVPFWMRHAYTAQVVAINSAGVESAREVTISIR
jgi:hypothetical protein